MRAPTLRRLSILAAVGLATGASGGTSLAAPAASGVATTSLRTTGLEVELRCERFLNDTTLCSTIVYGGDGNYSYLWMGAQPTPFDPGSAYADCYYGQYHYVEVLVTDGAGRTGDAWLQMQC